MKRKYVYIGIIIILCAIVGAGVLVQWERKKTASKKSSPAKVEKQIDKQVEQKTEKQAETEVDQKEKSGTTQEAEQENQQETVEPPDDAYVRVLDYIPDIVVELKYATADNFTGAVIYDFSEAYLRYGTVKKLAEAQEKLKTLGYRIKIWDAYRPFSAQERLWQVCPNPQYVANPANGMKAHNLGGTIDMTIVTLDGGAVEMPSEFDDFSVRADRDYSDVSDLARNNATMLEQVMSECGFVGYRGEWWDYSDTTQYAPVDFEP